MHYNAVQKGILFPFRGKNKKGIMNLINDL